MAPEAALKRPLRPQTCWFCPARQDVTSILQVRLEPAGRGTREDSLRAGTRHVVRDGCAGPSGPGRGAAPCCRTVLGGSWAVAPGVFLPSAPSLHGFSPWRAPMPYRGQRPEFGGGVWLHASFLEKEPSP